MNETCPACGRSLPANPHRYQKYCTNPECKRIRARAAAKRWYESHRDIKAKSHSAYLRRKHTGKVKARRYMEPLGQDYILLKQSGLLRIEKAERQLRLLEPV